MSLDAFFKKDRDVTLGAVELALRPSLSLTAGCHESERLFIIDDSVMDPAGADAVREALHGEFHVFCQAVAAPAVFLDDVGGNAHACAAKAGGQSHIVLAQMPEVVDRPEGNGKCAGYPCICRIFGRQVSLKDFLAFEKTVVHDGKEIQVNKVIRIEDAERIVILIQCEDLREYPVHGIAFADEFLIGSFKDESSVLAGDVCRIVRAVVRDDVDVIEFLRVLQELQVFQKVRQYGRFIVRWYDDRKFAGGIRQISFFSMPHAEYSDDRVVNREEGHDQLYREHDYIEVMVHCTFPSVSPF